MRRGKESAERIKKRASCSTPDTIDTHWAVVVTTSKGDGANADRFQLRPGQARPLAPSLSLQFPLWSITLSASDMHIQQLIKAVKADRYDQIFGQCHVVPTYMPASNLLYASAITKQITLPRHCYMSNMTPPPLSLKYLPTQIGYIQSPE